MNTGSSLSKYSLGNMGYSTVECINIPLEIGTFTLSCPFGKIGHVYN